MGTCKKSEYVQSIKNETEANNAKTDEYETDNTSDRRRFTGKSVVVTGAAAGMGKAFQQKRIRRDWGLIGAQKAIKQVKDLGTQSET